MDLQLSGKTALVTGASVGLGRCMAQMLAKEGCELAIVARRESLLDSLAQDIQDQGGVKPLVIVCDITQADAPARIREQVMQRWGGLDILVNNAGGSRPFAGIGTREQWDDAMNLNFHAGRELTHALLPDMQARGAHDHERWCAAQRRRAFVVQSFVAACGGEWHHGQQHCARADPF